jgi:sulfatase maturation enzyme AslB (radical SAM superfamily)
MKLFPFNMVVTNGTIELPNWKNCVFNVSIDGTKKYYEQIRGKGLYDIVKKNINRSNVKVNISCVLNKKNYLSIEDMLKEWRETKVGGLPLIFIPP